MYITATRLEVWTRIGAFLGAPQTSPLPPLPEGPARPGQDPEAPRPLDRGAAARLDEEAQVQAWAGINSS